MAQAIRRSPRHLAIRQALRRFRGGWRKFIDDAVQDTLPRTAQDWTSFAGLCLWFALVGIVFANWWGGA